MAYTTSCTCILFLSLLGFSNGFPFLAPRSDAMGVSPTSAQAVPATPILWSPVQLVDVTGAHAYQDPQPGQARGPCPAQNALANHGYIDRSGSITFLQCVDANVGVFNMGADFASFLCLLGQFTGGDLFGLAPFSIGNSSSFDVTVQGACSGGGILGMITKLICNISKILDTALGTSGFGMAQTHNSFEADSSFFRPDWNTIFGLDASTNDMSAVNQFWTKKMADDTFDSDQIIIDWASYRKNYGIATNPCYFRSPQATLAASLGAYWLVPRMFSNHSAEKPSGTLTAATLASFYSLSIDASGRPQSKGMGRERIPENWYHRSTPYTIPEFVANDFSQFFLQDLSLLSIGGNTNGVNTFTGADFGDLTGGVIRGANLLDGDNFACFYYRVLQIQLLNKLPSTVGAGLLHLGSTLGEVLDSVFGNMVEHGVAACPGFNYTDIHTVNSQWCGVRQQPGAML